MFVVSVPSVVQVLLDPVPFTRCRSDRPFRKVAGRMCCVEHHEIIPFGKQRLTCFAHRLPPMGGIHRSAQCFHWVPARNGVLEWLYDLEHDHRKPTSKKWRAVAEVSTSPPAGPPVALTPKPVTRNRPGRVARSTLFSPRPAARFACSLPFGWMLRNIRTDLGIGPNSAFTRFRSEVADCAASFGHQPALSSGRKQRSRCGSFQHRWLGGES